VDFLDSGQIEALLSTYGYALILLVVACESAGLPLPGETILVSAAIYAGTTHNLEIAWVVAAATCGAIVGDNVGFWLGRELGPRFLRRVGPTLGLDERRQRLGAYLFRRHGGKIVFFGRFVALLRAFAALLAGVNRLPPLRFFIFNAAGAVVWASIFGLGGYIFGKGIHKIAGPVGWTLLVIALISAIFLWRFYKRNEERLLDQAEASMKTGSAV
jgi:membrane protein DedA with SNARE-associated domain